MCDIAVMPLFVKKKHRCNSIGLVVTGGCLERMPFP